MRYLVNAHMNAILIIMQWNMPTFQGAIFVKNVMKVVLNALIQHYLGVHYVKKTESYIFNE